jgi:allantoin racemase
MKILLIRPIVSEREDKLEEAIFEPFASVGTEIKARRLTYGPTSIESEYDMALSAPDVLKLAEEGEREGYDGAIINCFVNPGLDGAKEAVRYPIVGAGEASINLALCLGRRIGIITIMPNIIPLIRKQNQDMITTGRIVSIRSIDTPVLGIYGDQQIFEKMADEANKAIVEEGADTIVLGCTGLGGMAEQLSERLQKNNLPVPVVDPAGASLKMIEALVACKLRHSKIAFMTPTDKTRIWPHIV